MTTNRKAALVRLRDALAHPTPATEAILRAKDEVLRRYSALFQPDRIVWLSDKELLGFLRFENNRHWTGLHRMGPALVDDMDRLRQGLHILVDESRGEIGPRLDEAVKQVTGLGRAIATAILLVAYPDRYGVWNNPSEAALKTLLLWPEFSKKESLGSRYTKINQLLLNTARELGCDLWTLDAALWQLQEQAEDPQPSSLSEPPGVALDGGQFNLEKHLQEFLVTNWKLTKLAEEWDIYADQGDESVGVEYPTGVGKVDILARHKTKPSWLVIELKKDQSSDQTLGQVLRYIGWVKQKLADGDDTVSGLILARQTDERLAYALQALPPGMVQVLEYKVHLDLVPPKSL